jgi:RNA polymerase sigma factor (sigma-70 family)
MDFMDSTDIRTKLSGAGWDYYNGTGFDGQDRNVDDLRSLLIRARDRDVRAYGEVVRRFQDMAYGYAFAILGDFHLAEDAAQEALIEAYRCLPGLREPAAFAGWFRRIVFKHCDRLTRRKRVPTVPMDVAQDIPSPFPGPAESAEHNEVVQRVVDAIRSLPEQERAVTTLYYVNGYSQQEVADFLEVPVATVNSRLHSSRNRLKERMMVMVADTLKSSAPDRDEARDKVSFLLEFAERIGAGQFVLKSLQAIGENTRSEKLRAVIRHAEASIHAGGSVSGALRELEDVFPPMVLTLIEDGERFRNLDLTLPCACRWLRDGSFSVDPLLFAGGLTSLIRRYVKNGLDAGAVELVIDSTRIGPHPDAPDKPVVWVEQVMPDGTQRQEDNMDPRSFRGLSKHLRNLTILDEHQEGDCLTGTLFAGLMPSNTDPAPARVSYQPLRDGEVIRIRFASRETAGTYSPRRTLRTQRMTHVPGGVCLFLRVLCVLCG